ncbi:MAG: hypothetical protein LBD49_04410 [Oscillospiraceae bacterium]|jgi:hypothetical protein|nr:hypothetical protein [Oscillospiraceae bacterium]
MDEYYTARNRAAHTPRRRSYRGAPEGNRRVSKLALGAAALLAAIAARYAFPNLAAAIGDKVSETFNYRAALAAIGEGLSGERRFTEALGEAWTVAFTSAPDEGARAGTEAPARAERTPEPDITPDIAAPYAPPGAAGAALAALAEASREYADYMIPAGAGYAM